MLPEIAEKYAPYVFAAYGIAIAALAGIVIWTILRAVNAKKKLDALEASESKGDKTPEGGQP